jgi:putative hydrolase of the HAD superfamily
LKTSAIIFDFDGLIVDTETTIYDCWAELYAEHGETLALETYKGCVGSDFDQFHPGRELEKRTGKVFDWATLDADRERNIRSRLDSQDARPGVRDFIAAARARGLPLAVASSSSRAWVSGWLQRLDLHGEFGALRNRDDVERIKPEPDLFLAAAKALGVAPERALVLEDSENGLRAATAAGIPCAIITNPVTAGGRFDGAVLEAQCFTDARVQALI